MILDRPVAHRVACPTCGQPAQLRVLYPSSGPAFVVLGFSCRNQTSKDHETPTIQQLVEAVPRTR